MWMLTYILEKFQDINIIWTTHPCRHVRFPTWPLIFSIFSLYFRFLHWFILMCMNIIWPLALFFILVPSLQHLHLYKHLCQNPTVQRSIQAEIQVHAVCPNVVLVNLILQTDMYIFFQIMFTGNIIRLLILIVTCICKL